MSWILTIDPWVLNPEIPVAASQQYLDYPEIPNRAKSYTCAVQANLPRFPDGKWKHAVSHVPRVYEFGHGHTSSRTPLIILVFGEFGSSASSSQGWRKRIVVQSKSDP